MWRTVSLLLALCLLLIAAPSAAKSKKPACKTPRDAASSVFSWQRPKNRNLEYASACFETEGRTAAQLQQLAVRLKLVYDAHGARILMDKISDAPDYEDVTTLFASVSIGGLALGLAAKDRLAEANIDNYGLRKYRRCFVTLGLTYDTSPEQMQAFVEGVRAVIQANPRRARTTTKCVCPALATRPSR